MNLNVQLDMRGLAAGIVAAERYSKRTLPQIINTSAYWVAVNAKKGMPFVKPDTIDKELGVIVHPVIGKRGQPLKGKKQYSTSKVVLLGPKQKPVPLGAAIVAAIASETITRQNRRVANWLKLSKNPFKGVSRAQGAVNMRRMVDKLIKKKHSSIKFLIAGWIPGIKILAQYAVQKFMQGGGNPLDGARNYYGADLGTADPAPASAGFECQAMIANYVGMSGSASKGYNEALIKHGLSPLQAAIDFEGKRHMDYALKKAGGEMASEVSKHWN